MRRSSKSPVAVVTATPCKHLGNTFLTTNFYFLCTGVLPSYLSVHQLSACWLLRPIEGVITPGVGVTDGY